MNSAFAQYLEKTGASFSSMGDALQEEIQKQRIASLAGTEDKYAPVSGMAKGFLGAASIPAAFFAQPYLSRDRYQGAYDRMNRQAYLTEALKSVPAIASGGTAPEVLASNIEAIGSKYYPFVHTGEGRQMWANLGIAQERLDKAIISGDTPATEAEKVLAESRVAGRKNLRNWAAGEGVEAFRAVAGQTPGFPDADAINKARRRMIEGAATGLKAPVGIPSAFEYESLLRRGAELHTQRTGSPHIPELGVPKQYARNILREMKIPAAIGAIGAIAGIRSVLSGRKKMKELRGKARRKK